MSDTRKKLLIHGRVQGVFYRGWSAETARALGLRGWVRNRRDGSVEMLLAGDESDVNRMIERCREGPPARVDRIDVEESTDEAPAGFDQADEPGLVIQPRRRPIRVPLVPLLSSEKVKSGRSLRQRRATSRSPGRAASSSMTVPPGEI